MPTASARTQTITFTGDFTATLSLPAGSNPASPGMSELKSLASGANTITIPTGGATCVSVTLIPPAGNTVVLTLKGIAGDSGIVLHPTDPTTIAIAPAVASFVLDASAALTGIRLVWS